MALISEQDNGARPSRRQPGERRCVLCELDGDDPTRLALFPDPAQLRPPHPVDVRPARQGVSPVERPVIVVRAGHGHAGADGVAGAKQRPEVRLVGHPQRGDDQLVPAAVLAPAALLTQVRPAGLLPRRHRRERELLVMFIGGRSWRRRRAIDRPTGAAGGRSVRRRGDVGLVTSATGRSKFADNRLTSSTECLLLMSMARIHIVETKLRGTAPLSVGAYPCLPGLSLDERQAVGREAGNTGSTDVRW